MMFPYKYRLFVKVGTYLSSYTYSYSPHRSSINFYGSTSLSAITSTMLKQKIVMHVDMHCDKCQIKCRKIAAVVAGFESMSIEAEKSHLIITGVGIDTATLANSLRKKVGSTSIISVEIIKTEAQKKEDEIKKKIKEQEEEAKKNKTLNWSYSTCNNNNNYSYPPPPPPPSYDIVCYGAPSYPNTWFTW